MTSRLISLQGGVNFRDLGGYPTHDGGYTRRGLIFRSGKLSELTDADRLTLKGLNIKTAFDLRAEREYKTDGMDAVGDGIEVVLMPTTLDEMGIIAKLSTDPDNFRMVDFYLSNFAQRAGYHAELFKAIVKRLANPLIIHCSAGKDRTGIMAALLLRVAGVADEHIITDYAETAQHLVEYGQRFRENFKQYGVSMKPVEELLSSYPETMRALLDLLDREFSNAEGYFMAGGVTAEELADFRQRFVAYL
jgi:protein-tyrosine phosphatase